MIEVESLTVDYVMIDLLTDELRFWCGQAERCPAHETKARAEAHLQNCEPCGRRLREEGKS